MQITPFNTVVVMTYTGPSLYHRQEFKSQWSSKRDLRIAFYEDVGLSALNLVELLGLCHTDIRLANITVHHDRFCLIDYDNCRGSVAPTFKESLVLTRINYATEEASMMLSIAQIALVVFSLETKQSASSAWERWLEGKCGDTKAFDQWVSETELGDVFKIKATLRLHCPHSPAV
jgi:hypothetical protein